MSEEKFLLVITLYVFFNFVLFFIYKLTKKLKVMHKIMSIVDNLIFVFILGYGFYKLNPLFIFIVPCVLLLVYPISWGLNKELTDEDLSSLANLKSPFPISEENRIKIKVEFVHFFTFPFFFLLDSWRKD